MIVPSLTGPNIGARREWGNACGEDDGQARFLTVGTGAATAQEHRASASDPVRVADAALYEAKGTRKNRVLRFCAK